MIQREVKILLNGFKVISFNPKNETLIVFFELISNLGSVQFRKHLLQGLAFVLEAGRRII